MTDILGFIKSGNLNMVAGLIEHHGLGQSVLLLRGFQEEIALYKGGEKLKTDQWSPLLLAIAFKRLPIVRYFIEELKISVRHAARPVAEGQVVASRQERAELEAFPLLVAVANKDLNMLSNQLWKDSTAWNEYHLLRVVKQLVEDKWLQGL